MFNWLKFFNYFYIRIVNIIMLDWLKYIFFNFCAGFVNVITCDWLKFFFNFYIGIVNVVMLNRLKMPFF